MKPILFFVSATSSYRLLRIVAAHFVRQGRAVAYLYERGDDSTLQLITADAAESQSPVFAFEQEIAATVGSIKAPLLKNHPHPLSTSRLSRIVSAIGSRRLDSLLRLFLPAKFAERVARSLEYRAWGSRLVALRDYRAKLGTELAAAVRVVSRVNPAAMVVTEDGVAARLTIHTAAREAGVPVIEVPFGYAVAKDLEVALENKRAAGELEVVDGICGRLIHRFAPQWIKRGAFAGALMFPAPYIVAAESLGMTVRDPWVIHGGYADKLCVESEQMLEVYQREGLPANKLTLTGTPYCDSMVRALEFDHAAKAAFRQPRRILAGHTRILVSWPPSYHAERGAHSEFPTYRDMSLTLLGWLSRLEHCQLQVSLHPAVPVSERTALIEAGIQVTDEYVIDLIGRNDVFITYFSSTIRWAIAAGKPVVNYDAYGVALDVFDSAPGVKTVNTADEFRATVTGLLASDESFAAVAAEQIAVAPRWGVVDGGSTARILDVVDELT